MTKFTLEGLKPFKDYKVCSLEWTFESGAYDIEDWKLCFSFNKVRFQSNLTNKIEGHGFNELLMAISELSSLYKDDYKFFIYVKNLRGFERIGENFLMWDGECFLSDDMAPFYLNCSDLPKAEFRNWDNFFDKIEDGMEFLDALLKVYNEFRKGAGFHKAFRYNITRELWKSLQNGYGMSKEQKEEAKQNSRVSFTSLDLIPTEEEFWVLKEANHAGLLYINPDMAGVTIEDNLKSFDISSSHIGFMARKPYPYKKSKQLKNITDFPELDKNECWIGKFILKDIEPRTELEIDLTKFGFMKSSRGNYVEFIFTNIDWAWFTKLYRFELIEISFFQSYTQRPLDFYMKWKLGKLYTEKSNAEKGTLEKDVFKLACEIPYGHSIKTPFYRFETVYIKDKNQFGKKFIKKDQLKFEDIYKKIKNNGVPYQWGIWTVSYSVYELITLIMDIGKENVVYCDTDSIKFLDDGAGIGDLAIEIRNADIQEEKDNFLPKDLGIWKFEHNIETFKAIGGKWYLSRIDGELDVKCAGANKDTVLQYLNDSAWPFANFNDPTNMPCACFKTITYPSNDRTFIITNTGEMCDQLKKEFEFVNEKLTAENRNYYRQHSWGTFLT